MPLPTAAELTAHRQRFASDPHRPGWHFTPPANWLNDPNGLIQWAGRYHLFYQHNPNGPFHGTMHWGHASSPDLVHWEDLPIALAPTPGGPDAAGCWSGCAVDNDGTPTILYTGDSPQTVCLATGSPDLIHWTKFSGNPIIPGPPPELAAATRGDFRDPYVWKQDGQWQMVIAVRIDGQGGAVLRYASADLIHWEYLGILLQGDHSQVQPFQSGQVWECPNFVPLGDRHVLIVSVVSNSGHLLYPIYFAGRFDGQRFTPAAEGILVHGASLYAPQVMRAADGRLVMLGWLREERPQSALDEAGWASAMSLPMVLSPLAGGGVGVEPAAELQTLRRDHRRFDSLELEAGASGLLPSLQGDSLEIEAVFEPSPEAEFGLKLCVAPDGSEATRLTYSVSRGLLSVEPSGVAAAPDSERHAPLTLDPHGQLRLHIFLDRSILEVFANEMTCLASRHYPQQPGGRGVGYLCSAGRARLLRLEAWNLASAF